MTKRVVAYDSWSEFQELFLHDIDVILGLVGMVWFYFWMAVSFEKPSLHTSISDEERSYIESSIGELAPVQKVVIIIILLSTLYSHISENITVFFFVLISLLSLPLPYITTSSLFPHIATSLWFEG